MKNFLAISAGTAAGFGILHCWNNYRHMLDLLADQKERALLINSHKDRMLKKLNLSSSLSAVNTHEDGSSN